MSVLRFSALSGDPKTSNVSVMVADEWHGVGYVEKAGVCSWRAVRGPHGPVRNGFRRKSDAGQWLAEADELAPLP